MWPPRPSCGGRRWSSTVPARSARVAILRADGDCGTATAVGGGGPKRMGPQHPPVKLLGAYGPAEVRQRAETATYNPQTVHTPCWQDCWMTAPDDRPPVLFHYTDLRGLIGILTEGKIRATMADLLNDRDEVGLGYRIIDKILAEDDEMQMVASDLRRHLEDDKWFVSCFSEVEDDLSMWRWYGAGQGYAVGFDSEVLTRVSRSWNKSGAELHRVRYGSEKFEEDVRAFIQPGRTDEALPSAYDLFRRAALVKDVRWASENEWRLLAFHHTLDGEDDVRELKIHASERGPVPYVELKVWDVNPGSPESALDSVWVGPGGDRADRVAGLKVLLRAAGLAPGAEKPKVRVSTAPLRI